MGRFKDLTGQVFGRLTVLRYITEVSEDNSMWLCLCTCGRKTSSSTNQLLRKGRTFCNYCRGEFDIPPHTYNPFQVETRTFSIWRGMLKRCITTDNPAYKHYGGRGIKVCDRWHIYECFLEDMGECPEGMSIDRIDVNGHYEPGNCRWATSETQNNNKRNNTYITFEGKTMTLAQWSKHLGVNSGTICTRRKKGWSPEECLFGRKKKPT